MQMTRGRSGFTLVELMIVLVMLGLVGAITVKVLTATQRITVAQGERAMMQSTTRTGVLVVPSELREINPALGDITAMDASSITYRGMRTLAVSCEMPALLSVRVATSSIQGLDEFVAGDSVLVFVEGPDKDITDDDGWARGRIANVSTATACPTGVSGTTLNLDPNMKSDATGFNQDPSEFGPVAVVRGFEHTRMAAYTDGSGDTWLGMEGPGGAGIQPVLGPIAADSGLRLVYRDVNDAETTVTTAVRSIDVTVWGITTRPVHKGQGAAAVEYDSLSTRIALRNTF